MKHTSGIFSFEKEHEIKVCTTSKFSGTLLEVLLDDESIYAESNCKKYRLVCVPVEQETVVVFIKVSSNGTPSMQLFHNDVNMVDGKTTAYEFAEGEQQVCRKENRVQLLRNLVMQFFLFGIVAFLVAAIKSGFGNLGNAALLGLLAGAGLSLLFMLFDLFEGKAALKSLTDCLTNPIRIDSVQEEVEDVNPDEIVVPDDAENFLDAAEALEEAETEAEAEEAPAGEENQ